MLLCRHRLGSGGPDAGRSSGTGPGRPNGFLVGLIDTVELLCCYCHGCSVAGSIEGWSDSYGEGSDEGGEAPPPREMQNTTRITSESSQ